MNTDKKIISLYNLLKKEGFEDEANLVKKAFLPPTYAIDSNTGDGPRLQGDGGLSLKEILWDIPAKYWMERPEYIEGVSLSAKILGVILTMIPDPGTTAVGVGTIRGTAAIDFAAAIARYKRGEDFEALLNILSGVISIPSGALKKIFSLMLSERVIAVYAFAFRSADRGAYAAAWSADKVVSTIPLVTDFLIASLEGLRDAADPQEDIGTQLGEEYAARLKRQCHINIEALKAQKQKINEIKSKPT